MNYKKNHLAAGALCCAAAATAAVPQGYYDAMQGKSGQALKEAARQVASELVTVEYGDGTWEAFASTDVRTVDGRQAWFDMYSNAIVWTNTGHGGLNIEHSVPNSWWGGIKNDAYRDLYHLNPSNSDANNRKSNHPLALIDGTPTWTNGVSSIGAPAPGLGGGSAVVFEPADEYKGDFARAYFYIFTIYSDMAWLDQTDKDWMYQTSTWQTLRPWAYDMLMQWAEADPVDSRELARNEAVAAIQGNRNPFIDIPALPQYIWGALSSTPFDYAEVQNPPVVDRPAAPVFEDCQTVAVNTYTRRWWEAAEITIGGTQGTVWLSVDGAPYEECTSMSVAVPAAVANGEQMTITAYAVGNAGGTEYRSSLSTLTLTAKDPSLTDLTAAVWEPVTDGSQINAADTYLLTACVNMAVMAADQGSSKFMPVAGEASVDGDGKIHSIPETSGIVTLLEADGGWWLHVADVYGNAYGYMAPTAARSLKVKDTGVAAKITVNAESQAIIDYGAELGTVQYNLSSPRFLNYTSTQQPVALWRMTGNSAVQAVEGPQPEITVAAGTVTAPAGSLVFDLGGRRMDASLLPAGIYIVVTPAGHHAKILVK